MTICIPHADFTVIPTGRGVITSHGDSSLGVARWPTDPIGTITATFLGVPTSSEIRVYRADGVELAGVESAAADNPTLFWSVYPVGANSVNRIVIINLTREIIEFNFTPVVGYVTIPTQMSNDRWYSNPA